MPMRLLGRSTSAKMVRSTIERKALPLKDLWRGGAADFDVSPYAPTTYSN